MLSHIFLFLSIYFILFSFFYPPAFPWEIYLLRHLVFASPHVISHLALSFLPFSYILRVSLLLLFFVSSSPIPLFSVAENLTSLLICVSWVWSAGVDYLLVKLSLWVGSFCLTSTSPLSLCLFLFLLRFFYCLSPNLFACFSFFFFFHFIIYTLIPLLVSLSYSLSILMFVSLSICLLFSLLPLCFFLILLFIPCFFLLLPPIIRCSFYSNFLLSFSFPSFFSLSF